MRPRRLADPPPGNVGVPAYASSHDDELTQWPVHRARLWRLVDLDDDVVKPMAGVVESYLVIDSTNLDGWSASRKTRFVAGW
jgi:hypothetical protein